MLNYIIWSMGATYIVGFCIAYCVNLCFIWRAWLLSEKLWIAICLGVVSTVRLGFGLTNCSLSFRYAEWKSFREHVYPTMVVGWVISVLADSCIAFVLCYYLRKHRSGLRRTDSVINRLLLYTINTGVVTSLFGVVVVLTFLTVPTILVFIAFVQVQSKLYAISLFATLNSRPSTPNTANALTVDDFSPNYKSSSVVKAASLSRHQDAHHIDIQYTKDIYGGPKSIPDYTSETA
ncbi:hypothetical protein SERLA73DRAFT_184936 [Serpula lacrymans var. lacrymans S7.3]|uniref:DUF6534 domain-containing protein n=1 Tax=Serpula lacrymans var. lacrymans (strain S7.3) TaxID=936435 RepID=F8Q3S1_SERL3|nr:hypothetical protein SERLA73DRAFT_184936 [Serpula lacrymans var. lacrymans S7.3]